MSVVVLVTGGFDPIHSGHLALIRDAAEIGPVVVGLNSDQWLANKKGKAFMPFEERKAILEAIKGVAEVFAFDDSDGTAVEAIDYCIDTFGHVIFANGGDRGSLTTPERLYYTNNAQVEFAYGVGGNHKANSSSVLLDEFVNPMEKRHWGQFLTYYQHWNIGVDDIKLKRLVIDPGKSISMQYHNKRSELWFIESGAGTIFTLKNGVEVPVRNVHKHDYHNITFGEWHRIENTTDQPLCIVEIQYGLECTEDDITRLE